MNVTKTTYNKRRYRKINVLSCQSYKSLYMENNITYIVLEEYIHCSKNIVNGNYYNKFNIKESKFICSERHIS